VRLKEVSKQCAAFVLMCAVSEKGGMGKEKAASSANFR
jgi:hypothetical protein